MSLRTLVEYAQQHFAADPPVFLAANSFEVRQSDRSVNIERPPRTRIPTWLIDPPTQPTPYSGTDQWLIDGPIDPGAGPSPYNVDALAYYLPFHFYHRDWGVYILNSGTRWIAQILKGAALTLGDEHFLNVAECFLVEHELCHAYTEIACTRAEAIARSALYGPYFSDRAAAEHEEAIANAHAFLHRKDCSSENLENLENWLRQQGPGYSDYHRWSTWPRLRRGRERAASHMLRRRPEPRPSESGSPQAFLYRGTDLYHMRIFRIEDQPKSNASILRPFPKQFGLQVLVHSRDHPPPHIHIHLVQEGDVTRYRWPELEPLENDLRLPRKREAALKQYLDSHGSEIDERVKAVYGSI